MQNPEKIEKRIDGMQSYRLHIAICPLCESFVKSFAVCWHDRDRDQHGWLTAGVSPEEETIGPNATKQSMPGTFGGSLTGYCEKGHEIHISMSAKDSYPNNISICA